MNNTVQELDADVLSSLVTEAQAGMPAAFTRIHERYAPLLDRVALRWLHDPALAQDVSQEAWLAAYQRLSELRSPAAFYPWIFRITIRLCIKAAHKENSHTYILDLDRLRDETDPQDIALEQERVALLWEAMACLPSKQHMALFLREVEGQHYKQIALQLQASAPSVEGLLVRARRFLPVHYKRIEQLAHLERCEHVRAVMTTLLEGNGTVVLMHAVAAHTNLCRDCHRCVTEINGLAAATSAPYLHARLPLEHSASDLTRPRGVQSSPSVLS